MKLIAVVLPLPILAWICQQLKIPRTTNLSVELHGVTYKLKVK